MGQKIPYIQRRGYGLTFRIAVPQDLRQLLKVREITKALPSSNRALAIPLALSLAHQAKLLFNRLRCMTRNKNSLDDEPVEIGYTIEFELDEFGLAKRVKVQAEPHEQAAVNSAIQTAIASSSQARQNSQVAATC